MKKNYLTFKLHFYKKIQDNFNLEYESVRHIITLFRSQPFENSLCHCFSFKCLVFSFTNISKQCHDQQYRRNKAPKSHTMKGENPMCVWGGDGVSLLHLFSSARPRSKNIQLYSEANTHNQTHTLHNLPHFIINYPITSYKEKKKSKEN